MPLQLRGNQPVPKGLLRYANPEPVHAIHITDGYTRDVLFRFVRNSPAPSRHIRITDGLSFRVAVGSCRGAPGAVFRVGRAVHQPARDAGATR